MSEHVTGKCDECHGDNLPVREYQPEPGYAGERLCDPCAENLNAVCACGGTSYADKRGKYVGECVGCLSDRMSSAAEDAGDAEFHRRNDERRTA